MPLHIRTSSCTVNPGADFQLGAGELFSVDTDIAVEPGTYWAYGAFFTDDVFATWGGGTSGGDVAARIGILRDGLSDTTFFAGHVDSGARALRVFEAVPIPSSLLLVTLGLVVLFATRTVTRVGRGEEMKPE